MNLPTSLATVPPGVSSAMVEFLLLASDVKAVESIILFGGLARGEFYESWTDVDLLLIGDDISYANCATLGRAKRRVEAEHGFRFDVVLYRSTELNMEGVGRSPIASLALNALSGRCGTGVPLLGDIKIATIKRELEREAAWHYCVHTIYRLRKLFVLALGEEEGTSRKEVLGRAIRWVASTIRCILRSRDVHSFPYEPSLCPLGELYSFIDLASIEEAFKARRQWSTITASEVERHLVTICETVEDLAFIVSREASRPDLGSRWLPKSRGRRHNAL